VRWKIFSRIISAADEPLRLVSNRVLGIIGRPWRKAPDHLLLELLHPIAQEGGDRDDPLIGKAGEVLHHSLQLLLPWEEVDLVEGKKHRGVLPPEVLPYPFLLWRIRGGDVRDVDQDVGIPDRIPRRPDHVDIEVLPRPVNARGIHKDDLRMGQGLYPQYPPPGGLGLRGDDGHLLAEKPVQQGGLPHIGPPHDGDKPRAELIPSLLLQPLPPSAFLWNSV